MISRSRTQIACYEIEFPHRLRLLEFFNEWTDVIVHRALCSRNICTQPTLGGVHLSPSGSSASELSNPTTFSLLGRETSANTLTPMVGFTWFSVGLRQWVCRLWQYINQTFFDYGRRSRSLRRPRSSNASKRSCDSIEVLADDLFQLQFRSTTGSSTSKLIGIFSGALLHHLCMCPFVCAFCFSSTHYICIVWIDNQAFGKISADKLEKKALEMFAFCGRTLVPLILALFSTTTAFSLCTRLSLSP